MSSHKELTVLPIATIPKSIHSDPEIMSGTPVFVGTRVPAKSLVDHLKAGDPLDEFLEGFPSVSREQAIAFLEEAESLLLSQVAVDEAVA